jgi:hypothetical protein
MSTPIADDDLAAIEEAVRQQGGDASLGEIAARLPAPLPRRTLQYRLKHLVKAGDLVQHGKGRWTRYRLPPTTGIGKRLAGATQVAGKGDAGISLSEASEDIRAYLNRPVAARHPVGYLRSFLDSYRPNTSFYLSQQERAHLATVGRPGIAEAPAGTYARQILNRLLIDLAWNSSRLEGNTYSLLDTRRLLEFGQAATGRAQIETQMILNHKDAIEFLATAGHDGIGLNRHTILNLHAMLANNLLADPAAAGRLRHIPIGIEQSVFHPLEAPQLIEECFDEFLNTASAIADPFEQALFVMVQLPYLQPFDDVNKRVSRLAANIPFVQRNLSPLSFTEVPSDLYTEAVLGVYELNRTDLLKDLFVWAYERSAARYAAVRQSLGEPDPFRLRYRDLLRDVVAGVVRARLKSTDALRYIAEWTQRNVPSDDREQFQNTAETELLDLHEGNFARYRITSAEFAAWHRA